MNIASPGRRLVFASLAFLNLTTPILITGCSSDEETAKTSHFEHDHIIADHWPDDLLDLSVKIRDRLSSPETTEQTRSEIDDLVSWTAEIAADTNLPEQDWEPLYHASESMIANLRRDPSNLSDSNRMQLESLCDLIEVSSTKIPDQLPIFVKDES
ncbi:hypothetical protein RSSM_06553 [Rhodopirellula sallentina SM41]|uniref:Uncharacterized protein n=2 Tax=Rhodopirellula TaxID=265488 RepID=M5TS53_9BACT|nr:hypothetical protein RSSM_06553 [Rhodopirellula sallentina SM41]